FDPPRLMGHSVVKVPRCGPDGNELGMLSPPEVAVPLATHTGWNLRRRDVGAEGQLASLLGSYIPFPKTEAERLATRDPRESIEERYGTFAEDPERFEAHCRKMVKDRYLLAEDVDRLVQSRDKVRDLFPAEK